MSEGPRPSFLSPDPGDPGANPATRSTAAGSGSPRSSTAGDADGAAGSGAAGGATEPAPRAPGPRHRRFVAAAIVAVLAVAGGVAVLLARPAVTPAAAVAPAPSPEVPGPAAAQEVVRLERRLEALRPDGIQVRVDTVENRLTLVRRGNGGQEVVLDAVCSTGTGGVLRDPPTGRVWVFDTPKGAFRVQEKRRNPVWTKPDWAFIEEGRPIPTSFKERRDPESLGDYALYLGDGYLIHGTLYQRLLGRSVTHGCVRLGDADLAEVYRRVPPGTPVYLF